MNEVFIGLGSNIGDRKQNIERAIKLLEKRMRLLKVSSLYETEPMYMQEQPMFLNCVAKFETDLTPQSLLKFLQSIEEKLGRQRTTKYGPRTIDLDILFYDDQVLDLPGSLRIPHPMIPERKFVLIPLEEVDPAFVHPIYHKTVNDLLIQIRSDVFVRKFGALKVS